MKRPDIDKLKRLLAEADRLDVRVGFPTTAYQAEVLVVVKQELPALLDYVEAKRVVIVIATCEEDGSLGSREVGIRELSELYKDAAMQVSGLERQVKELETSLDIAEEN